MRVIKSVQLFFQEGSSDKVYNAQIVEDGASYSVVVQWGRRGSHLSEGKKAVNVAKAAAERKFESLVREKRNKGYEEITDEVQPAAVAPPEGQGSGSKVSTHRRAKVGQAAQLLTAIAEDEVDRFLGDDAMIGQQKL